jgi:hypothetical protein
MKGAATMELIILEVVIVGLIAGLAGIIWMTVRSYFNDDHYSKDNRLGETPLAEQHDREEPHKHSPPQSKAAA